MSARACAALPPGSKRRLATVHREVLVPKPQGKWSAQEHTGHLLDLEPLWLARVNDFAAGADQLTAADLTNRKDGSSQRQLAAAQYILMLFVEKEKTFCKRVQQLDLSLFARAIPHPRLKTPMRLIDHLHFIAEHDDDHLAAIWQLVKPGVHSWNTMPGRPVLAFSESHGRAQRPAPQSR